MEGRSLGTRRPTRLPGVSPRHLERSSHTEPSALPSHHPASLPVKGSRRRRHALAIRESSCSGAPTLLSIPPHPGQAPAVTCTCGSLRPVSEGTVAPPGSLPCGRQRDAITCSLTVALGSGSSAKPPDGLRAHLAWPGSRPSSDCHTPASLCSTLQPATSILFPKEPCPSHSQASAPLSRETPAPPCQDSSSRSDLSGHLLRAVFPATLLRAAMPAVPLGVGGGPCLSVKAVTWLAVYPGGGGV